MSTVKLVVALLVILVCTCGGSVGAESIFEAIEREDAEAVMRMAGEGQIEARDADGRTPLMVAAERGQERIVQLLVSRGADIEARDRSGFTVTDQLESILRRVGAHRTQLQAAMRQQGLSEGEIERLLSASQVPEAPDEARVEQMTKILQFLQDAKRNAGSQGP